MKQINNSEALSMLEGEGVDCAYEADALRMSIEDEEDVKCFSNDETLIIIQFDEDTDYVTVVPLLNSVDFAEVAETIKSESENENISVLLNVQRLKDKDVGAFTALLGDGYKVDLNIKDFSCVEKVYPDDPDVRLLAAADAEVFNMIVDEEAPNRPPVSRLFDIFVNRGAGKIIGLFEGGRVVGYLSFTTMGEDVFDVDYIYVEPSERGKGGAKRLAKAYVTYAEDNKKVAYWSNAKNAASERTALAVGMEKTREAVRIRR